MEQIEPRFFQKHPLVKDLLSLAAFVLVIVLGTMFLNTFIYRSYNVVGESMENTLHGDDRVVVNRAAVSWAHLMGQEYIPERGQVIVFTHEDEGTVKEYKEAGVKNPMTCAAPNNITDQYIIKRVIAFPGERVTVKDEIMTIYNDEHPDGFVYDNEWRKSETDGPKEKTAGEVDMIVPEGELFVSGDNRESTSSGYYYSWDSRNGLGTIPYCRIIGPVVLRLFPLDKIRTF